MYHSILWINEDVFKQLSPIWDLCATQDHDQIDEQLQVFKGEIEGIFSALSQKAEAMDLDKSFEEEVSEDGDDLNFIE